MLLHIFIVPSSQRDWMPSSTSMQSTLTTNGHLKRSVMRNVNQMSSYLKAQIHTHRYRCWLFQCSYLFSDSEQLDLWRGSWWQCQNSPNAPAIQNLLWKGNESSSAFILSPHNLQNYNKLSRRFIHRHVGKLMQRFISYFSVFWHLKCQTPCIKSCR